MGLKNFLEKEREGRKPSHGGGIGNGFVHLTPILNVLHCAIFLLLVSWFDSLVFVFLACMKYVQDVGTFMKTVVSTQISCLYIVDAWFLNG